MSVNLSPVAGVAGQLFDNNGDPLTGGKIYTYTAGTTTPQATYTSSSGSTAHSNPIILDASGRVPSGEIWLTDGVLYKFLIEDGDDVLIGTYDNIGGVLSTVDASQVTYSPLVGPETNVQARLRAYEASTGAALIGFSPASPLVSTNVQDAIEEVQTNVETVEDSLLALTPGLLVPRTKPTGFAYVPGNIFDCVTSGQAKHDIDLEWEFRTEYALNMGPEYGPNFGAADTWVDPINGNDSNTGTLASPVKTIKHAVQTTLGTIWLLPAVYTEKLDIRYSDRPNRAMMIKAWGADGSAILSAVGQQPSAMTWTASGSGWSATPAGGELAELIIYNEGGKEIPIQYKTSKANVDAQGYGWYQDPSTKEIYLRYEGLNVQVNKANFEICYQTPGNRYFGGATIFFKGIRFRGGNQLDVVYENANRPRFYAQNCSFEYMAGANVHTEGALILTQNCVSRNALVNDGFNYYDSVASGLTPGGVVTQALEVDNVCINNGVPECVGFVNFPSNQPRNKQGSSGHESTIVCRINGEYSGNYGQNIADTGATSKTWMVGTICKNPRNIYVSYPTAPSSIPSGYFDLWLEGTGYLDTVTAGGRLSTYGLWLESGTTEVYRCGFSGTVANTGGTGTLVQKTTPS